MGRCSEMRTPRGPEPELSSGFAADILQDGGKLDRKPRSFLQVTGDLGIVRGAVLGPVHGDHQPIKMLRHDPATQSPVRARPFEQFVGERSELGHNNATASIGRATGSEAAESLMFAAIYCHNVNFRRIQGAGPAPGPPARLDIEASGDVSRRP
jgi:hypothetical protein